MGGMPTSTLAALERHFDAMREEPELEPRGVPGKPGLPFLVCDSMGGLPRVCELIHTASRRRARGFLFGTASAPALSGSNDPRQPDIVSHVLASTVPNCGAYDPAFASEVDVILDRGSRQMMESGVDQFYYVTVSDEVAGNLCLHGDGHDDVMRGMHLLRRGPAVAHRVQLFGSGAVMGEVLKAVELLERDHGIAADVWSVTSYVELAREGFAQERLWRQGGRARLDTWFGQQLAGSQGPIIAVTDYVRALPEMVRAFVPPGRRYITLGTDGGGPVASRAALRQQCDTDAAAIVQASLRAVGEIVAEAMAVELRGFSEIASLGSI